MRGQWADDELVLYTSLEVDMRLWFLLSLLNFGKYTLFWFASMVSFFGMEKVDTFTSPTSPY